MAGTARLIGGASIVLAPLVAGIGGLLAIGSRPEESAGLVDTEWGVDAQLADLDSIAQHQLPFTLSGYLFYAAALVAVPALVAVWRLTVVRSPRWAWAAVVLATLGVIGQITHLGYWAHTLAAVELADRRAAAEFLVALDAVPFVLATFAPFLLGLLAPVLQAVALRRAGVVPLWAALSIVLAVALNVVIGNVLGSHAAATALLVAGFAPAAAAMIRQGPVDVAGGVHEQVPVTA